MAVALVTGFRPFTPLTERSGNPSEIIDNKLASRGVERLVMEADDTVCLSQLSGALREKHPSAVLTMGAEMYLSRQVVVLELAGEDENREPVPSAAAAKLKGFAKGLGVRADLPKSGTAGGVCLRSYGAALAWAEPRRIPCIFLHLDYGPFVKQADYLDRQEQLALAFLSD